ncbi:MAG TPA: photosystem II reaction center PsbP [Thermosynechococcaceae cyanobacterium]
MLKRILVLLLVVVSLSLQACNVAPTSGFNKYIDTTDGYRFLYPLGWLPVKVSSGPDVVFHDLIHQSENVSIVINPVSGKKTLQELGSPSEVGYKLGKNAIAPPDSGREADLINAEQIEAADKTYYLLEYAVKVNGQTRHNVATVGVGRGNLYTLNASTTDDRWEKMKPVLEQTVRSLRLD